VACQAYFADDMPTGKLPIRPNPAISAALRGDPPGNLRLKTVVPVLPQSPSVLLGQEGTQIYQ
jgi:hypothetical protein